MKRNAFALSVAAAIGAFGLAGVATAGVIAGGSFNITGSAVTSAGTPRVVGADALVPHLGQRLGQRCRPWPALWRAGFGPAWHAAQQRAR